MLTLLFAMQVAALSDSELEFRQRRENHARMDTAWSLMQEVNRRTGSLLGASMGWTLCLTSSAQTLAKGNLQPTDVIVAAAMENCLEQENKAGKALEAMKASQQMLADYSGQNEITDLTMAILRDRNTEDLEAVVNSNR